MKNKNIILDYISRHKTLYMKLAKDIWDHPQIGFEVKFASDLITEQLKNEDFYVKGIKNIPNSFVASWGKGRPIIGILGEYDALAGLSQEVTYKKKPLKKGAPGHGCGHNLLGIASLAAVVAAKNFIKQNNLEGTIRYYGCPAEEMLLGKVMMTRERVFDDLDSAISWHPKELNTIWRSRNNALNSFKINFYGKAAHAASAPEAGLSALDGAILMDIGVNYLREHIIPQARIHSVITKGGTVPNIVPDYSQVWYYVRAPQKDQVENIYKRVLDIAKGAALMSGTKFTIEFLTSCHDFMPNNVITEFILEQMKKIKLPHFTEKEKLFGKKLQNTVNPSNIKKITESFKLNKKNSDNPFMEKILEHAKGFDSGNIRSGSTDLGDVSHIVPTGQFAGCCFPLGIPNHSWQIVAISGSSIGFKGMIFAAKVLALTATGLLTKPEILKAAHEEFNQVTKEI